MHVWTTRLAQTISIRIPLNSYILSPLALLCPSLGELELVKVGLGKGLLWALEESLDALAVTWAQGSGPGCRGDHVGH